MQKIFQKTELVLKCQAKNEFKLVVKFVLLVLFIFTYKIRD